MCFSDILPSMCVRMLIMLPSLPSLSLSIPPVLCIILILYAAGEAPAPRDPDSDDELEGGDAGRYRILVGKEVPRLVSRFVGLHSAASGAVPRLLLGPVIGKVQSSLCCDECAAAPCVFVCASLSCVPEARVASSGHVDICGSSCGGVMRVHRDLRLDGLCVAT